MSPNFSLDVQDKSGRLRSTVLHPRMLNDKSTACIASVRCKLLLSRFGRILQEAHPISFSGILYVEAQIGLFYLHNESKPDEKPTYQQTGLISNGSEQEASQKSYLQLIAGYAYTETDNRPDQFLLGEF